MTYPFMIREDIGIFDTTFKPFHIEAVHWMLRHISDSIDALTEIRDPRPLFILESPRNYPLCTEQKGVHVIYLSEPDNYWCRWVYQYSHEYLHHVINGPMSGEISGMKWFEEALCEMSSIWQLASLRLLSAAPQVILDYTPGFRDYLRAVYREPSHASFAGIPAHPELQDGQYHREVYKIIACRLLPVFRRHPELWKAVAHMGDSCQYHTCEELLERLRPYAPGGVMKMADVLFP